MTLSPRLALHGLSVLAALSLHVSAHAQAAPGVPLMKPPLAAKPPPQAPAGAARTITWEALVPANWDPFKDFKGLNFQTLDDGDPRANEMLKKSSICRPSRALVAITTNALKEATQIVRRRCSRVKPWV